MQYLSYPVDTTVFTGSDEPIDRYTSRVERWREVLIAEWTRTRRTLNELSEGSGLNRGTVHRILDDSTKDPGINTIERLAAAFGMSMIDLYSRASTLPRQEGSPGAAESGGTEGRDAGLATRFGDAFKGIIAAAESIPIADRAKFIRSAIAVLTTLEHATTAAHDHPDATAQR